MDAGQLANSGQPAPRWACLRLPTPGGNGNSVLEKHDLLALPATEEVGELHDSEPYAPC